MIQGPKIKLQQHQWRLVRVALAMVMGLAWYQSTPGGRLDRSKSDRKVHVVRQPNTVRQPSLGEHSEAWQLSLDLEQSINSLSSLKHPTASQRRELARLEQKRRLFSRRADYELRLKLHEQDSSFDPRSLRQQLNSLSLEAHR